VTHVKGGAVNEGGGVYDMVKALNDLGDCAAQSEGQQSEDELIEHADNGNPLIIGWTIPAQNHAVAYAGYNSYKGKAVFKIMNPSGQWQMMTHQAIVTANNTGTWSGCVTTAKGLPTLKLKSLNTSGVFAQGDKVEIKWEANFTGTIDIQLLKGGSLQNEIATSVAISPSTYGWSIAEDLPDGRDYKIKLIKTDQQEISVESNFNFTLNTVPEFTSEDNDEATVNEEWTFIISIEDNCEPDKLEFSTSTDIPSWITLESNNDHTATLKGTPEQKGTYNFTLMVKDEILIDSIEQKFTLEVSDISAIKLTTNSLEDTSPGFAIYPNPVPIEKGEAQLSVNVSSFQSGDIKIYNATGTLVDEITIYNNGVYSWDLKNKFDNTVASGTYLAVVTVYDRLGAGKSYRTYLAVKE